MFETFKISFSLRNTYFVNSFIYSIKQIPLIGKLIPESVYGVDGLKILAQILIALKEIISTFAGKCLYLLLIISMPVKIYDRVPQADAFVHLLFFLTLVGAIINTAVFNPTKDKYYGVILLRLNATKYAVSDYWYHSIKHIIGMLPFILVFGILNQVPVWICILFPFFVVAIKAIYIDYCLQLYKKSKVCANENHLKAVWWIIVIILLGIAYGFPALAFTVSSFYYGIVMAVIVLGSIKCFFDISSFNMYREMYQELLQDNRLGIDKKQAARKIQTDSAHNNISSGVEVTSNRHGFEYFNELFIKRHKKVLWFPAVVVTAIVGVVIVVALGIIYFIPESRNGFNNVALTMLPYMVFIMYLINRGTKFTSVLFMNCDHCMLTYNFYKKPGFILHLFQIRLREIVKINLLPAAVMALGATLVLYTSGGTTQTWNYVIMPVSIMALSIFFSVHYLTCYYLLQPYNFETDMKSKTYHIVMSLTYFISFMIMRQRIDTYVFGICAIIFCVAYCIIASILVYKLADKTFRIRN